MKASRFGLTSIVLVLFSAPAIALAQDEAPAIDTGAAEPEMAAADSDMSLNFDVETASAYVWRGANLLGEEQSSQTMVVFPSATMAIGSVSFGYWGAYQLTGDLKSELVDGGVGAESDLWIGYDGAISDDLGYSASLTAFIYPLADEEVAGTSTPLYLEPLVGVGYATAVDLGLSLSYFRGMQDETRPYSFVYINPSVGKEVPLTDEIGLGLGLGLGYKVLTNLPDGAETDGELDAQIDVGVSIPLDDFYIAPAVHAAWLKLDGVDFGDEIVAWGGVNLGYDLAL